MTQTPDTSLRRIYADIARGYTEARHAGQTLYVKHLTVFDQTEIDTLREISYESAIARGLHTEVSKLKWLMDKGLWSTREEGELAAQRGYLDNLDKTRGKLAIKSQIDQVDKQIAEASTKLAEQTHHRDKLIGLTAEQVADKRVQYEYIRLSFYRDTTPKARAFDDDDIAALRDGQTEALLYDYIAAVSRFSPDNLRRIVIAPFFTNQFYLCGDDTYRFFCIPVANLTIYQANLLTYGAYFKAILTNNDLPKEILNNPDKIEDYVARSRNLKNLVNKTGPGDRVALIGATSDDFRAMGVEDGSAAVRADMRRGVRSGMEAAQTREVAAR